MAYETMVSLNPNQARSLAEQMNFAPREEHDTYFVVSLFRDGVNCVSYPDYMEAEKGLPSPAEAPLGCFVLRLPRKDEDLNLEETLALQEEMRLEAAVWFTPIGTERMRGSVFQLVFYLDHEPVLVYADGKWTE